MAGADPVILYAGEKETVARRLDDALAAAGYPAALSRIGSGGNGVESVRRAGAAIVIWSKALMGTEPAVAALDAARRRGSLIEASADGIAPVPSLDEGRVALLSGWRGEPHHPGWQKILADLKRLSGPPMTAAARSASPAAFAEPARGPARAGRIRIGTAAAVAAVLLLFMGLGAAAWITRSGPSARPPQATASLASEPAVPAEQPVPGGAAVPSDDPAPLSGAVAEGVAPEAKPAPARPAARVPTAAPPAARSSRAAPPRERASRDSNTRNMRLFCEGSGRRTPQCRSFRRAAERASAAAAPQRAQAPVRYRNTRNMRRFCDGGGRDTAECRLFRSRTGRR